MAILGPDHPGGVSAEPFGEDSRAEPRAFVARRWQRRRSDAPEAAGAARDVAAAPQAAAAGPEEKRAAAVEGEVTTVMVGNLDPLLRRAAFLRQLGEAGFLGSFDVVHMPMVFGTGKNQGAAYVNFVDEGAARECLERFPRRRRAKPGVWQASLAHRQGFEATAGEERTRHIRSYRNRPLVLDASQVNLAQHAAGTRLSL